MKNREILDNPNKAKSTIWIAKAKKMLLISGLAFMAGGYSISQSTNESGLLSFYDYPDIIGSFLGLVSTIVSFAGIRYWYINLKKKEKTLRSYPYILVLQIFILIPSIFGAFIFIFVYCYKYLYAILH